MTNPSSTVKNTRLRIFTRRTSHHQLLLQSIRRFIFILLYVFIIVGLQACSNYVTTFTTPSPTVFPSSTFTLPSSTNTPTAKSESTEVGFAGNMNSAVSTEQIVGHLNLGESISIPLDIDTSSGAYLTLVWRGQKMPEFSLTSPNNEVINQAYVETHPNTIEFESNELMIIFFFKEIQAGTWKFNIKALGETDYKIFGLLESNLDLTVKGDKYYYQDGDTVVITAQLKNQESGVSGAIVSASLGQPDGTIKTVTLEDKGNGIYETSYKVPSMTGYVVIDVIAKGQNGNTNFSRFGSYIFSIAANDVNLTGECSDKMGAGNQTLDVQIGIDAGHAGEFVVSASLVSGEKSIPSRGPSSYVILVSGNNTITIQFFGSDIRRQMLDGPYTVDLLGLTDMNTGVPVIYDVKNICQTSFYKWQDFRE